MNESTDLTAIAVALGRIEEKVNHLAGVEERLRNVETAITQMEAKERPKPPWWAIAGGLAGCAAAIAFTLDMLGRLLG